MAVTPPTDLATGDIIAEAWVDAVRAAIVELQAGPQWQDFVPQWTQGAVIQVKAGYVARYTVIGKTVHVVYSLVSNSGGTAGQIMALTVPTAAPMKVVASSVMGTGFLYLPPHEPLIAIQNSAAVVYFVKGYDTSNNFYGADPATTIVANRTLTVNLTYETT